MQGMWCSLTQGPGQGMGLLQGSHVSCHPAGATIGQVAGALLPAVAASGPGRHAGCRPGPPGMAELTRSSGILFYRAGNILHHRRGCGGC